MSWIVKHAGVIVLGAAALFGAVIGIRKLVAAIKAYFEIPDIGRLLVPHGGTLGHLISGET